MDEDGFKQRVYLLGEMGRYQEVLADASRLIQLHPDLPEGYQNRARAHHLIGNHAREIADLSRYIELRPDDHKAYRTRAVAHGNLGEETGDTAEFSKAIDDLTRAMELEPQVIDFDSRANCLIRLGEFDRAIPDFTRVIDWNSEQWSTIAILKRGMAYELFGVPKMALADYAHAAGLKGPLGEYAGLWRLILLSEQNRTKEAQEILIAREADGEGGMWTGLLFDLFAGTLSSKELLEAATIDDERAEAYYYIGRKAMLDDQPTQAFDALSTCIALNRTDIIETEFARALHRRLRQESEAAADESLPAARSSNNSRGSQLSELSRGG